MKVLLLILTIFIVAVHCKKPKPGFSNKPCPVRPYVQSLDTERIAGIWYGIKAYPSFYYQGLSCYIVDLVITGPYKYNQTFCEKFNGENACAGIVVNHIDQDGKAYFNIEGQNRRFSCRFIFLKIIFLSFCSY